MKMVEILKEFVKNIRKKGIYFKDLRYKPYNEANIFIGDYDFLFDPTKKEEILKELYLLSKKHSFSFLIDYFKFSKLKIMIFDNRANFVILELWSNLEVKDPYKKSIKYIFFDDIYQKFDLNTEALYYLSHLGTKKKNIDNKLVKIRIAYYKEKLQNNEIKELFANISQRGIKQTAHLANMKLIEKQILFPREDRGYLKKEINIKFHAELHHFKLFFLKQMRFFPVIGVDGAGKTTIIKNFIKTLKKAKYYRFKKTFRGSVFYNLIYPILKAKALRQTNLKKIDKNQVDDIFSETIFYISKFKFLYFILANFLFRNYVFADRYFFDFLFKNVRFSNKKTTLSNRFQKLLQKIPQAYAVVHLAAIPEIIHKRKQEISKEDIDFIQDNNFVFNLKKTPIYYLKIDTSLPIEKCLKILQIFKKEAIK